MFSEVSVVMGCRDGAETSPHSDHTSPFPVELALECAGPVLYISPKHMALYSSTFFI